MTDAELCRAVAEVLGMNPDITRRWDFATQHWIEWNPLEDAAHAEQVEWALIEAGYEIAAWKGTLRLTRDGDVVLRQCNSPADKRRLLCEALAKLKEGTNG